MGIKSGAGWLGARRQWLHAPLLEESRLDPGPVLRRVRLRGGMDLRKL